MYWFLLLSFIIAEQQVLTDFHWTGSWALARTCFWPQKIHWKRCTQKNGRTSWLPISPPYPVTHAWTLSWYSKGSVSAPVLNNRKKKESWLTPMSAERQQIHLSLVRFTTTSRIDFVMKSYCSWALQLNESYISGSYSEGKRVTIQWRHKC